MDPLANGGIYSGGNAPTGSVGPIGSAGTGSRPNAPIVTPPDIQINSGMSLDKKPKKGLIIGGILAVVLLIVAVIFGVMSMNRSGGNGGGSADFGYNQFLIYANYLLNGSENTAAIGNYDEDADYTVVDAYFDEDKEYMETLKGLWDNFYNKFMASEMFDEVSVEMSEVEHENELLDFLMRYMATEIWDEDEIFNVYISNGLDGAKGLVEEHYSSLSDTVYDYGKVYVAAKIGITDKLLDVYNTYSQNGCIENSVINDVCVNNNNVVQVSVDEYRTALQGDNLNMLDETVNELINTCFIINNVLRNNNG